MSDNITQLIEFVKRMRLSAGEKADVRSTLVAHIDAHPVSVRTDAVPRLHTYRATRSDITSNKFRMTIALMIALLLSGGVSYAAEGTAPGDMLYGVKTHVNENVRHALAVGARAEANLEGKLATERLEEAEKLAAEGRLDAKAGGELHKRFKEHNDRAEEHIRLIVSSDAEGAAEASSELEASLKAHGSIMKHLRSSDGDTLVLTIDPIILEIEKRGSEHAKIRIEAEAGVGGKAEADVKAAAEGKARAAAHMIAEVKAYIANKAPAGSATSTRAEVNARVAEAEQLYAEGRIRLESGAYREAFAKFQGALRTAQEAKHIAKWHISLRGDVKEKRDDDDDAATSTNKTRGANESTDKENEGDDRRRNDAEDAEREREREKVQVDAKTEVELKIKTDLPVTVVNTSGTATERLRVGL